MINIHYALQTCDVSSYQGLKRFASDNRTEISKKSIKSLLYSIQYCADKSPHTKHHLAIIDDHSTKELKDFIYDAKKEFSTDNISITVIELTDKTGIRDSIEYCYRWLQDNGKDLVYQIQDDYIFTITTIYEMLDIYFQVLQETSSQCIVSPWNDSWLWLSPYRNRSTPRAVLVGKHRYWIQYYDMSCSFLTSHEQFSKHWDLYNAFFELIDKVNNANSDLENISLNYMLTMRGVLGLVPVNSLAFHLQSELEKDPYIDWKPIWDSVEI